MRAIVIILLLTGSILTATTLQAETITSTLAGGDWAVEATWVGGVVPTADDDVVIAGPVVIDGTEACWSLDVLATGTVSGVFVYPGNTLQVSTAVSNAGTIEDGGVNFWLEVGGDLHNEGNWLHHQTTITGSADRYLSQDPASAFHSDFAFAAGAGGDLIATTALDVVGYVDMSGGRLVLQPDCPFYLTEGAFSGEMLAGGNEMHFISWSYLENCNLDDVVLVGEVEASFLVSFSTRLTVEGILQNLSASGGAVVHGDLINNGVIRNLNYSFPVHIYGNLVNNGDITCPTLSFEGEADHHISMSDDALISANVFLPEFQPRTLIADTPVSFANGLGLGVGTLILEPGSSLEFTSWGGLGSGTVMANGNEISIAGNGALSSLTIDQGVIADQVAMHDDVHCLNGLTVTGTITSWPWAPAQVTVEGLLRNEGEIRDGDHPVTVIALNDLQNLGTFSNAQVVLAGSVDQAVGAGPGIAAAAFVLESGLQAQDYQWYRDNLPLPEENSASLTLATVGIGEYGTYHCQAGEQVSRSIIIAEDLQVTGLPDAAAFAVLEQNHPNPFNPATAIAFSLERRGPVSLTVYDLAGRRVATLVEGKVEAGRHQINWQPRDLPSGTYVYRLRTGNAELSRKCSLLK